MAVRNFVAEANMAYINRMKKNPELFKEIHDSCRNSFYSNYTFAHFMAHEEYLKVYDYCDKHNMIQGFAKRAFKFCNADFKKYDDYLEKNMEERPRNLIIDFCNQIYGGMEKEILDLTLTFKFYYERHGVDNAEWKAQLTTCDSIINMAADLWHMFFQAFKDKWFFDLSFEYEFAKLDDAAKFFDQFAEDKTHVKKLGLHPTENYASRQAFNAIAEKMTNTKFIDQSGLKALKFNHYDKIVNEIERDEMGIDKLKEKYGSK